MRPIYAGLVCVIFGVLAAISGCTAVADPAGPTLSTTPAQSSGVRGDEPGVAASPHGADDAPDYQTLMANYTFIQRAEQELIRRCMVKAGFQYAPMEPLPAKWRQPAQPLTVQAASTSGYASVLRPINSASGAANQEYVASLSPAEQARYAQALSGPSTAAGHTQVTNALGGIGIPTSGCTSQADADLFGNATRWASLTFTLVNITSLPEFRPQDDSALQRATTAWSQCMGDAGYRFANPGEAQGRAAQDSAPANPTNADGAAAAAGPPGSQPGPARDIAVADAKCRAATGWDAANIAASRKALATVLAAHEADVLAYNEMATNGVAKARKVLGQ